MRHFLLAFALGTAARWSQCPSWMRLNERVVAGDVEFFRRRRRRPGRCGLVGSGVRWT